MDVGTRPRFGFVPLRLNMKTVALCCTILCSLFFPTSGPCADTKINPGLIETESRNCVVSILEGLARGDYVAYSSNFSEQMKKAHTREDFLALQKRILKFLGKSLTLDYLGYYVQRGSVITLFRGRFSKDKDDVLIKLVLESRGGTLTVSGIWFDTPALER